MPTEGKSHIICVNHQNQMLVPYVIYADFESITKPKTAKARDKSEITSEHQAYGFDYQVVRYDGQAKEPVVYRGKDTVEVFLNYLECEQHICSSMTEQSIKDHENATQCWICEQEIGNSKNNPKVRDHFISLANSKVQHTTTATLNSN